MGSPRTDNEYRDLAKISGGTFVKGYNKSFAWKAIAMSVKQVRATYRITYHES